MSQWRRRAHGLRQSKQSTFWNCSRGGIFIKRMGSICLNYEIFGTFREKVVNSLFGETWRIAEFGSTNCQLAFERCQFFS